MRDGNEDGKPIQKDVTKSMLEALPLGEAEHSQEFANGRNNQQMKRKGEFKESGRVLYICKKVSQGVKKTHTHTQNVIV